MTIYIDKVRHTLSLNDGDDAVFSCPVMLSRAPGAKRAEGDQKTPEGAYFVCTKNPNSKFHLALGISYPSAADARIARSEGRLCCACALLIALCSRLKCRPPQHTPLGGFIMIHGEDPSARVGDWTAGCFAVKNADMDVIYARVNAGDRVIIE